MYAVSKCAFELEQELCNLWYLQVFFVKLEQAVHYLPTPPNTRSYSVASPASAPSGPDPCNFGNNRSSNMFSMSPYSANGIRAPSSWVFILSKATGNTSTSAGPIFC
jgi:hypothetical protein